MPALLIGLCLAFPGASEADAEERLPGSGLTARDALDRSDLVVVARVADKGRGGSLSGMGEHFSGVSIEVIDRLKGEAAKELTLELKVQSRPGGRSKRAPEEGREYLVFLRRPNVKQVWTTKVMHPTEESLRLVRGLMKEGPLPGSGLEVREAAEYARVVAVGRVIEVAGGGAGEPGRLPYHARVRVARYLKGKAIGDPFVYLTAGSAPNGESESVPEVGQDYLLFLSQRPGEEMGAIKIVRPTEAMLRRAKEWLAR